MPLDDDVKRELDSIRAEMRDELRAARTPRERESVRAEAREDLEDVLRREGYRLSRRELDEIMSKRDEDRIAAAVDRRLAELEAEREAAEEDDDAGDDDGEKKKKPPAKKPAAAGAKKPAGGGDGETEEEWV